MSDSPCETGQSTLLPTDVAHICNCISSAAGPRQLPSSVTWPVLAEQSLCSFVCFLLVAIQAVFRHKNCLQCDILRLPVQQWRQFVQVKFAVVWCLVQPVMPPFYIIVCTNNRRLKSTPQAGWPQPAAYPHIIDIWHQGLDAIVPVVGRLSLRLLKDGWIKTHKNVPPIRTYV